MITKRPNDRVVNRSGWYDRNADLPKDDATTIHISPKARGQLVDGFAKLDTPKDTTGKHLQMKSEKDRVGSKWPGPKGRVGTTLHGKASPSSAESFMRTAKNKEFQAK